MKGLSESGTLKMELSPMVDTSTFGQRAFLKLESEQLTQKAAYIRGVRGTMQTVKSKVVSGLMACSLKVIEPSFDSNIKLK